jgi:NAD-dependent deacetylase sirtuin 4
MLYRLNPQWKDFLDNALESGALTTEDPDKRREKGLRSNPDGDVDVPGASYTSFRYPACPKCLHDPPKIQDIASSTEITAHISADPDGAWVSSTSSASTSTSKFMVNGAGIIKPNVIYFGESIPQSIKDNAENIILGAGRLLVLGSSLATYSAWRIVKQAHELGLPIGVINLGGVRGEDILFDPTAQRVLDADRSWDSARDGIRIDRECGEVLDRVIDVLH